MQPSSGPWTVVMFVLQEDRFYSFCPNCVEWVCHVPFPCFTLEKEQAISLVEDIYSRGIKSGTAIFAVPAIHNDKVTPIYVTEE